MGYHIVEPDGGDRAAVCREPTNQINEKGIGERDDRQLFLSLWECPGLNVLCSIWSTGPVDATATAGNVIINAAPKARAYQLISLRLSPEPLAGAISELEAIWFNDKAGMSIYLVLEVFIGGRVGLRFLRSTSHSAASAIVKAELTTKSVLHTFELPKRLLVALRLLIASGKNGLIEFPRFI
jgi:hypothetical protein